MTDDFLARARAMFAKKSNEDRLYGPPGCLSGDTVLNVNRAGKGFRLSLSELVRRFNGGQASGKYWHSNIETYVQRADEGVVRLARVSAAWESGIKRTYQITTETGRSIRATDEHPFMTKDGWQTLGQLGVGDFVQVNAGHSSNGCSPKKRYHDTYTLFHPRQRRAKGGFRYPTHRLVVEARMNGLEFGEYVSILRCDAARASTLHYLDNEIVHHINVEHTDNHATNLAVLEDQREHASQHNWGRNVLHKIGTERIVSITGHGDEMTYDIEVADNPHCFMANGFVVHNTGKTTTLAKRIVESAKQYGSDKVLVTSFTKAAAVELVGRNLPVDSDQVGTLHAICYRALGLPPIAETRMSEWNEAYPQLTMTASAAGNDDPSWDASSRTEADHMMASYQTQRSRMVAHDDLEYDEVRGHSEFVDFVKKWQDFKTQQGYFDFTDMLEVVYRDFDMAPGEPSIMYLDEAQDLAPLELALARKWGRRMETLVICGDDDQCLYQFKGCDPESLFSTEPRSQEVLAQSYRVPRAVHALANTWIKRLSWRVPKEYRPRDVDGFVKTMLDADYGDPCAIASGGTTGGVIRKAKELVSEGKTVMFLASCSYMLRDTISALKDAGVPFHNQYKQRRGDWNPLATGKEGRRTATDRIMAYCKIRQDTFGRDAHVWTDDEFKLWATSIKADGVFRRGMKSMITSSEFSLPADSAARLATIKAMLHPDVVGFDAALQGDLDWLTKHLTGEQGTRMRYPARIAEAMGPRTLLERPRVTVGTIHSVKGGEADVIFIYPDISWAGMQEWNDVGPRRDSVLRLFYVALTRAREGVYLCGNAGQHYAKTWSGLT